MSKIALQLYSIGSLMEEDFEGGLAKIAGIGFDGVELSGGDDRIPAKDLRAMLEKNKLVCAGAHIDYNKLCGENYDKTLAYAKEISMTNIIIPGVPAEMRDSRASWIDTAKKLDEIGMKLRGDGCQLYFHNHWVEFSVFDHEFGIDILLNNSNEDNLKLQLDICWAERANVSSIEFMRRWNGRCGLLHMKDMDNPEERESTYIGNGVLDIPRIVEMAKATGVEWFTIEQEKYTGDMLEEIGMGYRNLRGVLDRR